MAALLLAAGMLQGCVTVRLGGSSFQVLCVSTISGDCATEPRYVGVETKGTGGVK